MNAEAAVLGGMVLSPQAAVDTLAALTPRDFHVGAHRTIFEAISRLHDRGVTPDLVTLGDELQAAGHLDDVGGISGVTRLLSAVPTAASTGHYTRIVAAQARRRRVAAASEDLRRAALDPSADLDEAIQAHRRVLADNQAAGDLEVLSRDELGRLGDVAWLVDGMLPQGLTALWGPSRSLKSFIALSVACSVATGVPWLGRDTVTGPAVYVAAEGASGMVRRIEAWETDCRRRAEKLRLVRRPVDLLDGREVDRLLRGCVGAALVVVDTMRRCMRGDENSANDVAGFVAGLDRVRSETGASVLVLHHSGQHDLTRMRGSGVLYESADCVVAAVRQPDSDDVDLVNEGPRGKQKDADEWPTVGLRAKPVAGSLVLGPSLRQMLAPVEAFS